MRYYLAMFGRDRFQIVRYNALLGSLDEYKALADVLELSMSTAALQRVKKSSNAEAMHKVEVGHRHGMKGSLPGSSGKRLIKVRSAGAKSILEYGLPPEFLDAMDQFVKDVFPPELVVQLPLMMVEPIEGLQPSGIRA